MASKRNNPRNEAALEMAAVSQSLESLAELSVLLPEPVAYITDADIEALIDPYIELLDAGEQAEKLMAEGRVAKNKARDIMEGPHASLKLQAAEARKQWEFLYAALEAKAEEIREELFSNPRVREAVTSLKDNKLWAHFTESLEKAIPAKLEKVAGELINERAAALTSMRHLESLQALALEEANFYGKQGDGMFFAAETMLKQAGFVIPQHKGGGAKGK